MSLTTILIIFGSAAFIIGALMLILQSAKKLKLTNEQLSIIKRREQEQKLKDRENS